MLENNYVYMQEIEWSKSLKTPSKGLSLGNNWRFMISSFLPGNTMTLSNTRKWRKSFTFKEFGEAGICMRVKSRVHELKKLNTQEHHKAVTATSV
jgi:hypothetical protein